MMEQRIFLNSMNKGLLSQAAIVDNGFGYGSREDQKIYKANSIFDQASVGQVKSRKVNNVLIRENLRLIN